jgi:heat shock protein HtpX
MDERSVTHEPVLVFDRIDANRRNTVLLLAVSSLFALPAALYLVQYLIMWLVAVVLPLSTGVGDSRTLISVAIGVTVFGGIFFPYLVYLRSASHLLRVSGARPLEAGEGRELRRAVENLCIGSGLPVPEIRILDSPAPNALSTGLSPEDATIVVTRGLLESIDRRELEGVLAQELSQVGNNDVLLKTVLTALLRIMLAPFRAAGWLFRAGGGAGPSSRPAARGCLYIAAAYAVFSMGALLVMAGLVGGPVVWIGVLSFLLFLATPLICLLLYRAVSREREFLADANAVLLTRNPDALIRALEIVSAGVGTESSVDPAIADLFFVNPRPTGMGVGQRWLSSHPPVAERIELLRRMGGSGRAVGPHRE